MTEQIENDMKIEMLIEGQKNLEKEKQELANKIVELTKQHEADIEKINLDFYTKLETLKLRIPRFAMIIDAMFKEEEKEEEDEDGNEQ